MSSTQQLLLGENAVNIIPNYIEEVFSTFLYTGNGATQTITDGIDLSTKGGLVWLKERNNARSHFLQDSARTITSYLSSDNTDAASSGTAVTALNTTGFTLGSQSGTNGSTNTYCSWSFRKQPKFFDVVTYTGNGLSSNVISHNLGSVPGFIICKRTNSTSGWAIWHRGNGTTSYGLFALNSTAAATANFSAAPTSTTFDAYNIWDTGNPANASGGAYVAYLFAHDAGGFGLTGTDNVISCGGYTGTGSTAQNITLGYEPQWVMIKRTDTTNSWIMVDNMRGFFQAADNALEANSSNAEAAGVSMTGAMQPIATGFTLFNANSAVNASGGTYIYIAIRRGPMKVPTLGTTVFAPAFVQAANNNANRVQTGFPVDMTFMNTAGSTAAVEMYEYDRIRNQAFQTYSAANQQSNPYGTDVSFASNTGFANVSGASRAAPSFNIIFLNFQRAPSFFDVVCYTGAGSGSGQSVAHGLGVTPELLLVKNRTASAENWSVLITSRSTRVVLNSTGAEGSPNQYFGGSSSYIAPTSSVFTVGPNGETGAGANTYVAYLFATCAGVSKVGSYTGTGTLQTIPCGFTSGARFVLIKRVDSTGAWYVWDSTRGISAGDDPYLLLNSTAPQVNNTNYVDTDTTGFKVTAAAPADINSSASGATYIFLAIA